MQKNVKEKPDISISELNIIGANEIFNNNDDEFIISYLRKEKTINALNADELKTFCKENGFDYNEIVLDIKVKKLQNGDIVASRLVRELIEYTDDSEKCLLSDGIWYKYNDDYLSYLAASISQITAEYNPKYDFTTSKYNAFIEEKYLQEKDFEEYKGKSKKQIENSLKQKYYAERAFNILIGRESGFQNFDRNYATIENHKIEPIDLFKEGGYGFAVKFGNTSAKLCYAIEQSLVSLKAFKRGELNEMPKINTFVLWFVLERKGHIEDQDGIPDINKLKLLMLKN